MHVKRPYHLSGPIIDRYLQHAPSLTCICMPVAGAYSASRLPISLSWNVLNSPPWCIFVKKSARLSVVLTYRTTICMFSTASRTKNSRLAMCRVLTLVVMLRVVRDVDEGLVVDVHGDRLVGRLAGEVGGNGVAVDEVLGGFGSRDELGAEARERAEAAVEGEPPAGPAVRTAGVRCRSSSWGVSFRQRWRSSSVVALGAECARARAESTEESTDAAESRSEAMESERFVATDGRSHDCKGDAACGRAALRAAVSTLSRFHVLAPTTWQAHAGPLYARLGWSKLEEEHVVNIGKVQDSSSRKALPAADYAALREASFVDVRGGANAQPPADLTPIRVSGRKPPARCPRSAGTASSPGTPQRATGKVPSPLHPRTQRLLTALVEWLRDYLRRNNAPLS